MAVDPFVGLDPNQVGAMGGDAIRAAGTLTKIASQIDGVVSGVSGAVPPPEDFGATIRGVAKTLSAAGTTARTKADNARAELTNIEAAFPPALAVDPDKPLFSFSNFLNPTSDEFGQVPLGISGFLFSKYGKGLSSPLYLPDEDAPRPTATQVLLYGPDGEPLLTREVPLLERQYSLQTLRGMRMDPVNVPGWADGASKALGVAGAGLSIYGAAQSQWDQDAAEFPHMSTGEHILRAATTGVVVGGSGAAGGWAGAEVGAEIGASVCAETGPGALICGGAGALIGGFVGSKLGETAGADLEQAGETAGKGLVSAGKTAWHGITHGISDAVSWL